MAEIPVLPFVPPFLTSWILGQSPMSTWPAVSIAILSYLTVIFGLQELMKDRPAFKLKTPIRVHNAFLSLSSLVLLALTVQEVLKLWYTVGVFNALCATTSRTKRLEFYYMVNYSFKYIEFLDTAWLAICLNLGVHVVMCGAKPWWKRHLTMMQIRQFIITIVTLAFGFYQHYTFTFWPHLPHIGDCTGDAATAYFGGAVFMSLLAFFVNFYQQTYTKADKDMIRKNKDKIQVTCNPGSGRKQMGRRISMERSNHVRSRFVNAQLDAIGTSGN
ncbi:hypothetical protein OG21DRAFT_1525654 [Imleria badia]|nr:hypothetical protein OG21DRAFT_1525654 [Imleria badia]